MSCSVDSLGTFLPREVYYRGRTVDIIIIKRHFPAYKFVFSKHALIKAITLWVFLPMPAEFESSHVRLFWRQAQ